MSAKYPRSFHLPWSPGGTRDDKRMTSVAGLLGQEIVITEKLDGSNLAMTRKNVFARSHNGPPSHPSFHWAKSWHAQICTSIDSDFTLFGEYCYAVHSIVYKALPGYFFLFGVRDDKIDTWWDWDLLEQQAKIIHAPTVPVLFRGCVRSETELQILTEELSQNPSCYGGEREGVVVRIAASFGDEMFSEVVGKYVRSGHVVTLEHWMFQEIRTQTVVPSDAPYP